MMRKVQAQMALQQKTAEALAELVDRRGPRGPGQARRCSSASRTSPCASRPRAWSSAPYLEATGQDQEAFVEELRETAAGGVRLDLALRAVADAEGIEVSDEDLDAGDRRRGRARRAAGRGRPRAVRAATAQLPLVRSDIRKRKALEWLIEHVEIVDEDGNAIDQDAFTVEVEDDSAEPEDDTPPTAHAEDPPEEAEDEDSP